MWEAYYPSLRIVLQFNWTPLHSVWRLPSGQCPESTNNLFTPGPGITENAPPTMMGSFTTTPLAAGETVSFRHHCS